MYFHLNLTRPTGLCSTTFKERLGVHKQSFKDETKNQAFLSKYIWDLKRKNKKFEVTWKIKDRGQPFSPVTGKCQLCTKEQFHIMFRPEGAEIDSRQEVFSACVHKISRLLIKRERKKKAPG